MSPPGAPGEAGGGRARHWDAVYADRGAEQVSWFQAAPAVSLELIDLLGIAPGEAVIDVGGGASNLVDHLAARGYTDLSVLDVAATALAAARRRLGDAPSVSWIRADVLAWTPDRRFDLWHDRAVFHFLVAAADRDAYLATMRSALAPGGAVIVGTFAADGPTSCSGLPVARYSAGELGAVLGAALGSGAEIVGDRREEHTTPGGVVQPFTWIAGRSTG